MTGEEFEPSRLRRLRTVIASDAPLLTKARRSTWLIGAIVIPTPIKRIVLHALYGRGLAPAPPGPIVSTAEPYIVRQPRAGRGDRPRIMHAIGNFMTGGSSQLIVDLYEHLSDEYEQEVMTGYLPVPPAYVGIPAADFRDAKSPKRLEAHLKAFRPDLLHIHLWEEPWYRHAIAAGRRYGCPMIENVNTPVAPVLVKGVRRYVFVSEYVRREFAPTIQPTEVIHPGSNLELFQRRPDEALPEDCLGMVYRLERDKLDESAIQVFIEAVRRRPSTRVLVVGDGPLRPVYEAAVADAGLERSFEFAGYVSYRDLPDYYRRMTVFVAPVWQESFGQVTSFAMGVGLPVAGYDVGALSEITEDRSVLAPAGDPVALAKILVGLLDDRDRRIDIGSRNARRVRERFTVASMVDSYRRLYSDVLRGAR